MLKTYRITVIALLIVASISAQDVLLKAKWFYDSENAVFIQGIDVLVKRGKISSIGKKLNYDASITEVINLGDATILPGLIDSHTHLFIEEVLHPEFNGFSETIIRNLFYKSWTRRVLEANARAKSYLNEGFTTIVDLGNSGEYFDVDLRDAIKDNLTSGSRMFVSGPGLCAEGGQMKKLSQVPDDFFDYEYQVVNGNQDAVKAVRDHVLKKVDLIKVYADNIPNRTMLTVDELSVIVKEASRYDLNVTAHAITNQAIWNAAKSKVNSIEHVYNIADTTLALIKKSEIAIIPTYSNQNLLNELYIEYGIKDLSRREALITKSLNRQKTILQKFYKNDLFIVFGSDIYSKTSYTRGQAAKQSLFAYFEAGIPINKVLQYATYNAAKKLRKQNQIGVIKQAAIADIIVVKGNLEENPEALDECILIMKNGEIIKRLF